MIFHLGTVLSAFVSLLLLSAPAVGAVCTKPAVRKEWRTLSVAQQTNWIDAVKCLANLPHDEGLTPTVDRSISQIPPINASSSYYDDFVYMHMVSNFATRIRIHFTGLFLPWHRWFVAVYESALKTRCGFKGTSPYWNWVEDSKDVFDSVMFKDSNPVSGLGGWGDPANDVRVPDGAFSNRSNFRLTYPSPHTLRRNWTIQPFLNFPLAGFMSDADEHLDANATFTPAERDKLVNGFVGDFVGFQKYFEGFNGSHGAVHLMMGGDLGGQCPGDAPADCVGGPTFSANEPLFWLHHGMVDKMWYDWQNRHPSNTKAFFGGSVQALNNVTFYNSFPNGAGPFYNVSSIMPSDGLFPPPKISDVLGTTEGMLCYVYE
ncbi:Di-copper centre-containing protein [Mycena albidolilacea]|uniref:Di-copper centre-containing protein n=1 Tax=Mycena albidolilacea TaxID=1033008 RepID=A0AAD7EKF6_9AGAR|nr:Di-copper centre-containing protein [Mycena albidolilacea]